MISRLSKKTFLVAFAILALLWLILSWSLKGGNAGDQTVTGSETSEESNAETNAANLVSAIQPISNASADTTGPGTASGSLNFRTSSSTAKPSSDADLAALKRRFDLANMAIEKGQLKEAASGLEALTSDFPSVIEPYLNLASLYAEQQQLEKARETLLRGFEANPKAGLLFDHLKKVHGALAASSYKQALDTNAASSAANKLTLARASNIVTQLDQSKQIATLEKQLQDTQSKANASLNEMQTRKVATLEARLDEVRAAKLAETSNYQQELDGLNKQLAEQSQALSLSQTAEREALARVVRAEQDASTKIAAVTKELESQQALLLASQALVGKQSDDLAKAQQQSQSQALALRDAQRDAENSRKAKEAAEQAVASINTKVVSVESVDSVQQEREQQAISLVQSWAQAWSAQDVPAYVSHYADNYSSSQSITRAQWLEQRQVRLTNKEFIKVKVGEFRVKDLGSQFSVTFSQYYQSNTVDDTVSKRLIFNKVGDDWSESKIVNERLVAG